MPVKLEGLFGDIKKPNVLHHPVQAKNLHLNPYIYILYHQSNMSYNMTTSPGCCPLKNIYLIFNGVLTTS